MPGPLKPCKKVGCPELTTNGYCKGHARNGTEQDRHRATASERGYDRPWHKRAKAHKARHPLCVVCELEGRVTVTETTHHIVPVSDGGSMHVRDDELLSVCERWGCHRRVERLGHGWRSVVGKL